MGDLLIALPAVPNAYLLWKNIPSYLTQLGYEKQNLQHTFSYPYG